MTAIDTIDEKLIDAIFAELDQGQLQGAAVGIAKDGRPIYRRGFGLAHMELPVYLSPSIKMRIASTTKHFTSLAYMLLCEEGRAGIDDPIGKHLPELNRIARGVTARQLMGHIGGLRDPFDILYNFSGTEARLSSDEVLSLYRDIGDVNSEPGTAWAYSSGGYLMLSTAIERITNRPLEDVLRESIFAPLGMYDTLLRRWDTDFVPNSATLHMTRTDGTFEKSYLGTALAGEGGMVSTVNDMLRWLVHIQSPTIGRPETWDLMKASQQLRNGTMTGYGLGLISGSYRGFDTLSHPGNLMGGNAQMIVVPAAKLAVIIMVNRHDVSSIALANKVIDVCVRCLDPGSGSQGGVLLTGTYWSPRTKRVVQLYPKDGQQIVSIDGFDLPFEFFGDDTLGPRPECNFFRQSVKLLGNLANPSSIQLTDFGDVDSLVSVRPDTSPDTSRIIGKYRSESVDIDAEIFESDQQTLRMKTSGRFGRAEFGLEYLAARLWRATYAGAMPWGGVMVFDDSDINFRFSTSRLRQLPFMRQKSIGNSAS